LALLKKQMGGGQCCSLAVLSDQQSWINHYIPGLLLDWLLQGHAVLWAHRPEELRSGDFCFMLGCGQIVPQATLDMFRHTLVVHESDLPQGKGWSPLTWQVLEGKDHIPVTLLEAEDKVDSGKIYAQRWIQLQGHELVDALRHKQAEATISLCHKFVARYPDIVAAAREQEGEESFYPRRGPKDSQLDPEKSIKDQFNLLRVVDNERYPAWFELAGQKYTIEIKKNSSP
jgi:methionyl-tRNA formyltransferase